MAQFKEPSTRNLLGKATPTTNRIVSILRDNFGSPDSHKRETL